jgi:hypothetical protein
MAIEGNLPSVNAGIAFTLAKVGCPQRRVQIGGAHNAILTNIP